MIDAWVCTQQQHSSTWPVSYITGSWQEIKACLVCLVSESNGFWIPCVSKCWMPVQMLRLKCKWTLLATSLILSAFLKSSTNDLGVLTPSNTKWSSTILHFAHKRQTTLLLLALPLSLAPSPKSAHMGKVVFDFATENVEETRYLLLSTSQRSRLDYRCNHVAIDRMPT